MTARQIQRTLAYAATIAGVAAVFLLAPLAKDAYAEHKKQQEDRRYATGLHPCDFYWDDFAKYIDTHLSDLPDVSIDAFPTFSDAEAIRVVGQDIFFFRVKGREITEFTAERAETQRSALSKETSEELQSLLTSEILHARAERPMGMDGTTYVFRTGRTNRCAMAWSPDEKSRAGEIVDIYYSAIDFTTNSQKQPITDAQLKAKIVALRDR